MLCVHVELSYLVSCVHPLLSTFQYEHNLESAYNHNRPKHISYFAIILTAPQFDIILCHIKLEVLNML